MGSLPLLRPLDASLPGLGPAGGALAAPRPLAGEAALADTRPVLAPLGPGFVAPSASRGGAGEVAPGWTDVQLQQPQQTAKALTRVASALVDFSHQRQDEKHWGEGALTALRGQSRWLVYLGRDATRSE